MKAISASRVAVEPSSDPPTLQIGEVPGSVEALIERLEEAGRVMLALPGSRSGAVQVGWRTAMPVPLADPATAYGYERARLVRPVPTAREISRMDEAFGWLALLPEERRVWRVILGLRALVDPVTGRHLVKWTDLARRIGCHKATVRRWHEEAAKGLLKRLSTMARKSC